MVALTSTSRKDDAGREGGEAWRPRFTYCGSRYLQVEGAVPADRAGPGDVAIVSLASEFVHTDMPEVGRFGAGQALLVQTHDLIRQAVLSNSASVFTDCPHREKLGWLEQANLVFPAVARNYDVAAYYGEIVRDLCPIDA